MSAETKLDADAFMRKYLERPSDATARLVFADWLEETGEEHNAAWAHFIRLKVEADRHPVNSPTRYELDRHAGQYAVHIRARLAIPAKLFVGYPKSLLELLPAQNITVNLAEFAAPREMLELFPESVARENVILPLDAQGRVLLIAAVNPCDYDTAQKLQFILNHDIVFVAAESDDIQDAINRQYGQTETESVGAMLVEYTDTAIEFTSPDPPVEPSDPEAEARAVRLVNRFLNEAIRRRDDGIRLSPEPTALLVCYRSDGAWYESERLPLRFLRPCAARFAITASIPIQLTYRNPPSLTPMTRVVPLRAHDLHFRLRVTIQPSEDGPTTQIDLIREPATTS